SRHAPSSGRGSVAGGTRSRQTAASGRTPTSGPATPASFSPRTSPAGSTGVPDVTTSDTVTVPVLPPGAGDPSDTSRALTARLSLSDHVFRAVARTSGAVVLVVMSLVGIFLAYRALEALRVAGSSFVTTQPSEPHSHRFGLPALLTGTVLIALGGTTIAVPLAAGTALYISEYAPARLKPTLTSLVDLMAAVPSVVYGLWGFFFLQGHVVGLARWISTYFSWIPIFAVPGADPRDPLATTTVYTS